MPFVSSHNGSRKKKKKQPKIEHHGVNIAPHIRKLNKTFFIWIFLLALVELAFLFWPIWALVKYGMDAFLSIFLLHYFFRGVALLVVAFNTKRIYLFHGMKSVNGNPLRILSQFSASPFLTIWWIFVYLFGVVVDTVVLIVHLALYTWYSKEDLNGTYYWVTAIVYVISIIESYYVVTVIYKRALDDNFLNNTLRKRKHSVDSSSSFGEDIASTTKQKRTEYISLSDVTMYTV